LNSKKRGRGRVELSNLTIKSKPNLGQAYHQYCPILYNHNHVIVHSGVYMSIQNSEIEIEQDMNGHNSMNIRCALNKISPLFLNADY